MPHRSARFFNTEAIVLRHTDVGEADRIVAFLTPGRGVVRAIAKGARKPSSKLGGHLDLMRRVQVSISAGRGLALVSQAETLASYPGLQTNLRRMSQGLYLCELTERFAVEDAPAPEMFRALIDGLESLERSSAPALFPAWYEMRLLALSGFQPEIRQCADCGEELRPEPHTYAPARGGIVCTECRGSDSDPLIAASVPTVKLLRYLARSPWSAVEKLRVPDEQLRETQRILRAHIEYVIERSVRSARFLEEVSAWGRTEPPTTVH